MSEPRCQRMLHPDEEIHGPLNGEHLLGRHSLRDHRTRSLCHECRAIAVDWRQSRVPRRQWAWLVGFLMQWDLTHSIGARARISYGMSGSLEGAVCGECGSGLALASAGSHRIELYRTRASDEARVDGKVVWSQPRG